MRHLVVVDIVDHHLPVALLEGRLDGGAQALLIVGADLQAVNDELYRVVFVAVELHSLRDLAQLAVDAHVQIALFEQLLEQILIVALAVAHERGEDVNLAALEARQHQLDDFLAVVFYHRLAGDIAAGLAYAGV